MASSLRATRPGVDQKNPLAGFRFNAGAGPAWFEAVFATHKELLQPDKVASRNSSNFFSTRAMGPLPAPRGEAIFILPPEVMARFAGAQKLFYTHASARSADFANPEVMSLPPDALPSVSIAPEFNGRLRRSMIGAQSPRASNNGNTYAADSAESLRWAGDLAAPGKMEPVHGPSVKPTNGTGNKSNNGATASNPIQPGSNGATPAPQAQMASALGRPRAQPGPVYDDGYSNALWAELKESEERERGIEGPIPDVPSQGMAFSVPPEYPQASRFEPAATGNFTPMASPRTISRVVIHITDGGANINGTISWFKNPAARVSAHYVVGQDGEVVQMVRHNDKAWHAGRANGDSIGIEHVANTSGLLPTSAEYCASAALVNWLCTQFSIPMDRTHILGHSEADTSTTHTACPNSVWDWDYFMGMVTSATCYEPATPGMTATAGAGHRQPSTALKSGVAPRGRSLSGQSFDVNWADVQLVPQLTEMSCWAAAASMLVGWRDQISIDPSEVARGAGQWAAYQNGLNPADVPSLASAWGLEMEPPQSYSIDGFRHLAASKGPLLVVASVPGLHAIVVNGVYGDGSPDNTYVRVKDPWGRAAGSTPGSPAPYNPTPGQGSEYQLTFRQFVQEYESAATDFAIVNIQILHSGGTGGRIPGTSSTQGFNTRSQALTSKVQAAKYTPPRAFSGGQSFEANWADVQLVPQPTNMSCWAAAAAMVVGWRDQISIDPGEIARGAGRWAAYKEGINPADVPTLANAWGLVMEPPQSYTIEAFRQMLESKGPLWVGASVPELHVMVVSGMRGDGSPDNTHLHIKDPWEPGQGSEYDLTFRQFVTMYEAAATNFSSVNIQILHSGGVAGRIPGTSASQGFSNAKSVPGIAAEAAKWVLDWVANNKGDIFWKLPTLTEKVYPQGNPALEGDPAAYRRKTHRVKGPRKFVSFDCSYIDLDMEFKYNGASMRDIVVTVAGMEDLLGQGISVEGQIVQEVTAQYPFGVEIPRPNVALLRYILTYHYDYVADDVILKTEVWMTGSGEIWEMRTWPAGYRL